jgi:hypothetical protein
MTVVQTCQINQAKISVGIKLSYGDSIWETSIFMMIINKI